MFAKPRVLCRRRATVLVMVVGVLAMLFIIGSTLLIVARFEGQNATQKKSSEDMKAVASAVIEPMLNQLREDILGSDGIPYNSGGRSETSGNYIAWHVNGQANTPDNDVFEDASDFSGLKGSSNNAQKTRNGDLLIASPEPYLDVDVWKWYAVSWPQDAITDSLVPPSNNVPFLTSSTWHPGTPNLDADGDGIPDSDPASGGVLSVSGAFGGTYSMFLRVIPHGGMVRLSQFTHPALLVHGIHGAEKPRSLSTLISAMGSLDFNKTASLDAIDKNEARLRRRFLLPENLSDSELGQLPASDLRKAYTVTMGIRAPTGAPSWFKDLTPHWSIVGASASDTQNDLAWWTNRMTPPTVGMAGAYDAKTDLYDRRHILTTTNSDDLLRSIRDETRLLILPGGDNKYPAPDDTDNIIPTAVTLQSGSSTSLYYILNPDSAGGVDALNFAKFPAEAYGRNPSATGNPLAFNGPGLRTQFSLRDVLVNPTTNGGYQASYKRAVQLTAYFLAMIQHTTEPGSTKPNPTTEELLDQVRTATQLAVNTIDFADNGDSDGDGKPDTDDPPSFFKLNLSGLGTVEVTGIEKQPFITEVYAKVAAKYSSAGIPSHWSDAGTIWAIELYNPYQTPISLAGYYISADTSGTDLATAAGGLLGAGQSIVFANMAIDPTDGANVPFVSGGVKVLPGLKFLADPFTCGAPPCPVPEIKLMRRASAYLNLQNMIAGGPSADVIVDKMDPNQADFGATDAKADFGQVPDPADVTQLGPPHPMDGQVYWRHTSVQRHKEPVPERPVYWHFTLASCKAFESDIQSSPAPAFRVHDLAGNGRPTKNPQVYVTEADPDWFGVPGNQNSKPIAGFPIIVADAGVEPLPSGLSNPNLFGRGCRAFPTTGSLLLVTRHGNGLRRTPPMSGGGGGGGGNQTTMTELPVAYSALYPIYKDPADATQKAGGPFVIDNGHMPVFDASQPCTDNDEKAGRPDRPWGQLVYSYFTALPLEELVNDTFASSASDYIANYEKIYSHKRAVQTQYPLVEQVTPPGSTWTIGPKVDGRINVNYAPQWVLDGLPVLPDAPPPAFSAGSASAVSSLYTTYKSTYPLIPKPANDKDYITLAGVPASELFSRQLDPTEDPFDTPAALAIDAQPGRKLLNGLMDVVTVGSSDKLPTVSSTLAQLISQYREKRGTGNENWQLKASGASPGFPTVGAIADIIPQIIMEPPAKYKDSPVTQATGGNSFENLRLATVTVKLNNVNTVVRPFAYLNYLHFVAPLVRIQDWATVKNHVFTIYSVLGDNGNPQTWVRTQVTVDRTNCLYSKDLPEKVAEPAPIGYFNAVSDQ